ncbi:alcohol dehydrogenase catalytic domain-containing protein [Sandarakinorhabdus sp.]|uniref:alcohol dehydrogenase catalytic domain-containing protein n=1 Tax=Sandarakinorhabdus sp. TaxID=1916663 RepID=UPI00286D7C41|nr:zinc-binding dehydrogenase [Sandarakinorhabdus sp.]
MTAPLTTTAAVLDSMGSARPYADSKPLRLATLDLVPPGPGELLVRIEAAGLCHSDLSVVNADRPRPMPMALGHEACATVLATGPGCRLAVGDRVVMAFLPACGHCTPCRSGTSWLCANGAAANGKGELLGGGGRLSECGHAVHHHLGLSAFADMAVIDERSAVKIDDDIPAEIAALFGCAVLTGMGAVCNSANVRPGESVAIWGLGGVGLAALIGAVAAGAEPVIAIDPVAAKRSLALELGARAAVHPDDAEAAFAAHGACAVAIESVGSGKVLAQAYRLAARGGRIVTVGLPNPADPFTIPAVSLVAEAKTIIGSYMGSAIPARDVPRYIALWRAGRLPVERLLSGIRPMSEINAALDDLASGAAIRQILIP